jgi:hypothetical protein
MPTSGFLAPEGWLPEGGEMTAALAEQKYKMVLEAAVVHHEANRYIELRVAAASGDLSRIKSLFGEGESTFGLGSDGTSLVYVAAEKGHFHCIPFLIKMEGVNIIDGHGQTPLWLASNEGRLPVVRELLRADADPNAPNRDGGTILSAAAQEGHLSVIRELVKHGARHAPDELPDERGDVGFTPLHMAAQEGFGDVVRYFVREMGIDPRVATRDGQLPIDLARESGHSKIVAFLESA